MKWGDGEERTRKPRKGEGQAIASGADYALGREHKSEVSL